MTVYVENPNEYRHKLLILLRQFSNVARYKFNNKNQRGIRDMKKFEICIIQEKKRHVI